MVTLHPQVQVSIAFLFLQLSTQSGRECVAPRSPLIAWSRRMPPAEKKPPPLRASAAKASGSKGSPREAPASSRRKDGDKKSSKSKTPAKKGKKLAAKGSGLGAVSEAAGEDDARLRLRLLDLVVAVLAVHRLEGLLRRRRRGRRVTHPCLCSRSCACRDCSISPRGAAANCSSLRLMCAVAASACATQRGKSLRAGLPRKAKRPGLASVLLR